MKKRNITCALWGVFVLLLSACGGAGSGRQTETPAPEAIFTSAALTAEARRQERFAQTATLPAESLIETSAFATPTQTALATEVPTLQASATAAVPAGSQPSTGGDRGEFLADVNIPDGTIFAPNETFQKTWRISNAGGSSWTTAYSLVYIDGTLMGAEPTIPLPKAVAAGENVEITVDMVAPPEAGTYRGYWKLRNASGQVFGFGANANEAIWVDIVVQGEGSSEAETETPQAAGAVASVLLSVDQPQVEGSCPHTFIFTAQITLSKPATLSYVIEAGSTSGGEIRLPQPATQNLGSGTHPVVYELNVPSDVDAWARLRITSPVQAFSNQVDFSLTCG